MIPIGWNRNDLSYHQTSQTFPPFIRARRIESLKIFSLVLDRNGEEPSVLRVLKNIIRSKRRTIPFFFCTRKEIYIYIFFFLEDFLLPRFIRFGILRVTELPKTAADLSLCLPLSLSFVSIFLFRAVSFSRENGAIEDAR